MTHTHQTAPTEFVEAHGIRFAYRRFGKPDRVPLVLNQHFTGTMDHWDPAVTDGLAQDREVILFNNAGVSSSSGEVPATFEEMGANAIAFIKAVGLNKVDVLGFSIGGFVAQGISLQAPDLVRRLILLGTGPRSGEGMEGGTQEGNRIFGATYAEPDQLWLSVFFTPSEASQAAGRRFRERQPRCHHLHGELFYPAAASAKRSADPVPGFRTRLAIPVSRTLRPSRLYVPIKPRSGRMAGMIAKRTAKGEAMEQHVSASLKPIKIPGPEHPITIERNPKRVVVSVAGRIIADTQNALTLREANYPPVQYIPRKDTDMTLLERTDHATYCPYKGDCAYYSIPSGGDHSINAVWSYEAPFAAVTLIRDYLAFYPERVDAIEERPEA